MKNASFSWSAVRGSLPVLHDISMDVTPGSLVVVVGPVASGKSTLVSGVFGFAQVVAGKSILRGRNDNDMKVWQSWGLCWDFLQYVPILGGGFKYFLFSPLFGEMIQFD